MKYGATAFILLAAFVALAVLIYQNNSQVMSFDHSGLAAINHPGEKILDKIMVTLSKYGREFVWIPVVAILFLFGRKDGRRAAVFLTLSFLILIPLGTVLKSEIDRQRPDLPDDNILVKNEKDQSFPSGHAVMVSAGATVLLLIFNRGKQLVFSIILAIESILVSYSRIYVGVHYPMDVIGGILLGAGVAFAVIACGRFMGLIFTKLDSIKR